MRLRIKVLLTTVAVMALGYVIVTLASVAQIMASARKQNAETVARIFSWAVKSAEEGDSAESRARLEGMLAGFRLVTGWSVVREVGGDQEPIGEIIAAENPAAVGNRLRLAAAPGAPPPLAIARAQDGTVCRLYGRAAPAGGGLGEYVRELLPAMLVGAVLMAGVLLMLLGRQVLGPVAELAAASRQLASGGDPARPRDGGRADEVGQLVRSFNRMADEVVGHRKELEKRVVEATDKFRRAQEAAAIAQRLAATGKLAAGVAHEINNPLGGMINAARRLGKAVPAGGREGQYLELINEGLERIGRIVKQMTRFQGTAPELAPVNVAEALDDALRFAEHRLEGVDFVREISEGLPPVLGDRHGLEQVFLNLVLNAADAVAGAEEKRITVRARAEEPAGRVVVEIEDTGRGMTPAERDAAFDIFHTTKGAGEGSGLGLPVAHSVVESHGGELLLEGAPGRGTRAVVRLPAAGGKEAST